MPGTFFPPPLVSDPDMHHGTCVTHVPWCTPGSLTSGFLWSRWWGKRSRHSRRMRKLRLYVSGKRPMALILWEKWIAVVCKEVVSLPESSQCWKIITVTSQWARWLSNHRRIDCLFNRLFRLRSKKTSKLRVTGLCEGNSPVSGEFPHKGPLARKMFPFDDVIMESKNCAYTLFETNRNIGYVFSQADILSI